MKNKVMLIVIGVLLVAVIAGAGVLYSLLGDQISPLPEQSAQGSEPQKIAAPELTIYDKDGKAVSFSDFRGKPVVLNFWASWCPPCKSEMPAFEAMYQKYGKDVHFIMLNLTDGAQETVESAKAYIDSTEYTFPVYFDSDLSGAISYGISSVPQTYFVDAEGYLVVRTAGATSAEVLEDCIIMAQNHE